MKLKYLLPLTITVVFLNNCRRYIEVDPPGNSTSNLNVYSDNTTAAAVLTGIYTSMSLNGFTGSLSFNSLSFFAGLSADELVLFSGVSDPVLLSFYSNTLNAGANGIPAGTEFWNNAYTILYRVNSAIEGISASPTLSDAVRKQLLGESKFIRALTFFYLTNLYGDVPLVLTSKYEENVAVARSTKQNVYKQIISDLKEAETLLSANYVTADAETSTTERTRPNKWAAKALLSRTYLYNKEWQNAENEASAVIGEKATYDMISFTSGKSAFDKNSQEAIWQLQPVNSGENTPDAAVFVLPPSGPGLFYPVYLRQTLVDAFELGDERKNNWIGVITVDGTTYNYPYKYKNNIPLTPVTEYIMVLRLAEQYLIRAEARAQLSNINGAKSDIDVVRTRAGLPQALADDQATLLALIMHERQVEFFSEWGHRWLDIKRNDSATKIMSPVTPQKGGVWESKDQLYPLPARDIQTNVNLKQNEGY